jgi:predicted acyl esterase
MVVITEGRLRAALRAVNTPPYKFLGLPYHRSFREDAQPLSADSPSELVFDLLPISQVFAKGHRIRLTITGADPREKDRPQAAPAPAVTVYREKARASYIQLPLIEQH